MQNSRPVRLYCTLAFWTFMVICLFSGFSQNRNISLVLIESVYQQGWIIRFIQPTQPYAVFTLPLTVYAPFTAGLKKNFIFIFNCLKMIFNNSFWKITLSITFDRCKNNFFSETLFLVHLLSRKSDKRNFALSTNLDFATFLAQHQSNSRHLPYTVFHEPFEKWHGTAYDTVYGRPFLSLVSYKTAGSDYYAFGGCNFFNFFEGFHSRFSALTTFSGPPYAECRPSSHSIENFCSALGIKSLCFCFFQFFLYIFFNLPT